MSTVPGTSGYEHYVPEFVRVGQELDFRRTNRDFIPYLPTQPARVLDAGCGAGQNAAALANLGHRVVALDPMREFVEAAKAAYSDIGVRWGMDSLPGLRSLGASEFEFILVDGVWHHLSEPEREQGMRRVAELLAVGGRCAMSLRNGPAGMGSCIYPTDPVQTQLSAERMGLSCIFLVENQPSIIKNKENVRWSRVVLEKVGRRPTPG